MPSGVYRVYSSLSFFVSTTSFTSVHGSPLKAYLSAFPFNNILLLHLLFIVYLLHLATSEMLFLMQRDNTYGGGKPSPRPASLSGLLILNSS